MTISRGAVRRLVEAQALIASGDARRLRQTAQLSLIAVGATVGADPSTIGRWERGERVPRGAAAIEYARLLGRLRDQLEPAARRAS